MVNSFTRGSYRKMATTVNEGPTSKKPSIKCFALKLIKIGIFFIHGWWYKYLLAIFARIVHNVKSSNVSNSRFHTWIPQNQQARPVHLALTKNKIKARLIAAYERTMVIHYHSLSSSYTRFLSSVYHYPEPNWSSGDQIFLILCPWKTFPLKRL